MNQAISHSWEKQLIITRFNTWGINAATIITRLAFYNAVLNYMVFIRRKRRPFRSSFILIRLKIVTHARIHHNVVFYYKDFLHLYRLISVTLFVEGLYQLMDLIFMFNPIFNISASAADIADYRDFSEEGCR